MPIYIFVKSFCYHVDMDIQKTALRLPQDLHQMVIDAAHQSGRSMNAEIVARLRATFSIDLKNEFNGNISGLGGGEGLTAAQEARVLELIREALKGHGGDD